MNFLQTDFKSAKPEDTLAIQHPKCLSLVLKPCLEVFVVLLKRLKVPLTRKRGGNLMDIRAMEVESSLLEWEEDPPPSTNPTLSQP